MSKDDPNFVKGAQLKNKIDKIGKFKEDKSNVLDVLFENDDDYDPDYYKYCKSCECGFCTENPKTEDCIRWKSEQSHT